MVLTDVSVAPPELINEAPRFRYYLVTEAPQEGSRV